MECAKILLLSEKGRRPFGDLSEICLVDRHASVKTGLLKFSDEACIGVL